jgi:hypothetical protein|tara:strand:- start:209 stop:451 length:243 start_codon:yes stop_codon:yes gene_type:complete
MRHSHILEIGTYGSSLIALAAKGVRLLSCSGPQAARHQQINSALSTLHDTTRCSVNAFCTCAFQQKSQQVTAGRVMGMWK